METTFSVSGDGRFILAAKAWHLGLGVWQYEYALYNMNCDRGAKSFKIQLPTNITSGEIVNIGFRDIPYHSGEIYDSTDWTSAVTTGSSANITWTIGTGSNNALNWGTLYNFRFQTQREPISTPLATIEMYKSGSPSTVSGTTLAPDSDPLRACCYGDDDCDVMTEDDCDLLSGSWNSSATSCTGSTCLMSP